jgi:hypothetical protein
MIHEKPSPPAVKCLIVFVTIIFLGFMIYYGAKARKIQAGCVAMVQDLELNASVPCDRYPKASYVRVLCWHKTINDYLDQLPLKTTQSIRGCRTACAQLTKTGSTTTCWRSFGPERAAPWY